jgi:hypothetical protein
LNNFLAPVGLAIVLVTAGLMTTFALIRRKRSIQTLRSIPAIERLRRSIGLAVEQGRRLHISLGSASIVQPTSASALVGLAALESVAQVSSTSDRPPVATSGDGTLALLSKDTMRAAFRKNNALDQYDPDRGRLAGPSPFTYAVGTIPTIRNEHIAANFFLGHFGPEVALLTQATNQENEFTIAGSDSLLAQSVLYATAQEPLIGEELFAVPAYLGAGKMHESSLKTQDILRWVLAAVLVAGSILTLVGIL